MLSDNKRYYPEQLSGKQLDNFLAMGWYRMGQSIFTTHFIMPEENFHRVFWLRYNLDKIILSKSQQRIINKNKQFNISIKPLEITDEIEDLYSIYKLNINFEASISVHYWLYGDRPPYNVYDTELIEVRDNDKLIAVGVFDWGSESITGIMNFYHPDYKRFSLGKYLMMLKMERAWSRNIRWYYPGYIVFQRPEFDYKLCFDNSAVEVLIPELESWRLYESELIEQYGIVI
jgi:leucyl-tRNA---protein transferase